MASYNELLALIDAYINQNGVQAITGQVLNGVLRAMVDQLGRGYSIMGAADPTTDPGTPDGPESWFASVPGTYTNFDGIQIADGELALLSYTPSDGFAKNTLYDGFKEVTAQIDGNVGTPAVGVSYANGILSFDFHNMKGETGDPAGFGSVSATIDDNIGTPSVSVAASGPDTARNFAFNFRNLKGETGVTSVLATVDNTSGNPQCAVSLQGQQLTLAFTGLKGAQGDTGSSVDYPFTIVNNLTTNDATQALSAAMGVQLESEVSQLEAKVTEKVAELDVNIKEIPVIDNGDDDVDVSDNDGNVIAKVNGRGLSTNMVYARYFENLENSSELNVCDDAGNVIFKINKNGIISPSSSAQFNSDLGGDREMVISDDLGNVVFKIDSNGNIDYPGIVRRGDIPSPSSAQSIESDNNFPCDINMVITHGQSNSMNGDNNSVANLDFKNSLTFASGTMSFAGGSFDNKTDEEINTLLGGGFADMEDYTGNLYSIGGNIAENISTIEDENGIADYDLFGNQYIGATTGQVKTIEELTDPNGVYYERILTAVRFAKKYADDEGKSFCLFSLTYIEGEANFNTAKKLFYDYLWVFFSNIAHDVMAITGQNFPPCFITYQFGSDYYMSSNNPSHIISNGANDALVQIAIDSGDGTGYALESSPATYLQSGVTLIDRSRIVFSCPFYMLDSQERETRETMHLNWSEGCYNIFGAYQGLQAKRTIVDGHSVGVLRPISHTIKQTSNGKYVITLEFDVPVLPLQIKPYDSNFGNKMDGVEYADNFGFTLSAVSHSWDYSNIIESVQVKRMKYVEIVTSSNPTGLYLNYAQKGWLGGGNLCDSQGNTCKFTTRGKTFSLDNWCPQFEYHLN